MPPNTSPATNEELIAAFLAIELAGSITDTTLVPRVDHTLDRVCLVPASTTENTNFLVAFNQLGLEQSVAYDFITKFNAYFVLFR